MMCAGSIAQLVLLTADLGFQVCFPAKTYQTELLADQSLLCTYGPCHAKTCPWTYADSEGPDHSAHPYSMTRALAVC